VKLVDRPRVLNVAFERAPHRIADRAWTRHKTIVVDCAFHLRKSVVQYSCATTGSLGGAACDESLRRHLLWHYW
jgi:hypothetical protein